jgi:hypothetical protein
MIIAVEIMHVFLKDEVQSFFNMTGCCKHCRGTVVRTGASHDTIFYPIFPCDMLSANNLMMLTQKSNKKIVSKLVGVLFPSTV